METPNGRTDAGLRSLNHYQNSLPKWRYWPRQKVLPVVRFETPYLAWFQNQMRSPMLDSYFAFTANLGTHTFFMTFLPVLFWCGYPSLGRGTVNVLAAGVFWSGFVKDLLCLPRPLSPPLQRITMSGSAALEYGFPSTHSTNAVSVAIYALSLLRSDTTLSPAVNIACQAALYIYALSIVVGRLYCGMHGFLDVVIGSWLGAVIAWVQVAYGPAFDNWIVSAPAKEIFLMVLIVLVLIRIHPEPADDCPCFDDSVSFAAVFVGANVAAWDLSRSSIAVAELTPDTIPYRLETLGWFKTFLRFIIGVLIIFAWREVMKPLMLRSLPPIFRGLEKAGLLLPRRFFTRASQYKTVPEHLKDEEVIPNFSDIPSILTSIRHPRRRAISIGPQSEADAYETLAYREKRRRESISEALPGTNNEQRPATKRSVSKLEEYESQMGTVSPRQSPDALNSVQARSAGTYQGADGASTADEQEMFSMIKKPRVRYDVEVVTRLIVYIGIGVIVVDYMAYVFDFLGLAP